MFKVYHSFKEVVPRVYVYVTVYFGHTVGHFLWALYGTGFMSFAWALCETPDRSIVWHYFYGLCM